MNPIDDMFRKGLDGRAGEVPADMWSRVQAGQSAPSPEGAELDKLFADGLKDHAGQVPADMWSRIAATGLPAAAAVDQVFADGLKDRVGEVPVGMWDAIWKARTAAPRFRAGRWASAAAVILLLLLAGWWLLPGEVGDTPLSNEVVENRLISAGEEIVDTNDALGDIPVSNDEEAVAANDAGQPQVSNSPQDFVSQAAGVLSSGLRRSAAVKLNSNDEEEVTANDAGQPQVSNSPKDFIPQTAALAVARPNLAIASADDTVENSPISAKKTATATESIQRPDQQAAIPSLLTQAAISPIDLAIAPTEIKVKGRYRPKPSNDRTFRASPRHRFQTELLFGAAYADQQFTPATGADRPLSDVREVSEFPELSYQVSLRGAYNLNERLVFLGGLTYAEIRNQFEYERTVAGATSLIVTTNSIRMLEAPLLLGYRMPGRRMQVSINAGPVVNISTRARGRFLDPNAPQPLDLATEGNYRRNVGVGFMTSLSTTYQIGKKEPFVLLVEPFFKAYPTAFTTKGAPLKETYWVAGLQLGVRKGF